MWRRRKPKLIGLLLFRDEMRYLPGYFQNIAPHVDGLVALDDASTDGSSAFVASQPIVLDVITHTEDDRVDWSEGRQRRIIIEAALVHHPCWFIALDADERLERHFRTRAYRAIREAEREQIGVCAVRLRDLWDAPDTYRVDGIWGSKRIRRLFASSLDHKFDDAAKWHAKWAADARYTKPDLIIYHLRMIHRADRIARHEKFVRADPDGEWQSIGYDYFLDEDGLTLERLPRGRGYVPMG
jgi:hypothetical protein